MRKRAIRPTNVCRGPGCNCGQSFKSREELQNHYLEKLCFVCKECDTAFPSKITLKEHIQSAHTGTRTCHKVFGFMEQLQIWPNKIKDLPIFAEGQTVKSHLIELGTETCMSNQLDTTFAALVESSS